MAGSNEIANQFTGLPIENLISAVIGEKAEVSRMITGLGTYDGKANFNVIVPLTVKTSEGFEMKNFKLVEGENGLFIGAPSQKGKDQDGNDKWFDTVWIPKELNQELIELVSNHIDPSTDMSSQSANIPF